MGKFQREKYLITAAQVIKPVAAKIDKFLWKSYDNYFSAMITHFGQVPFNILYAYVIANAKIEAYIFHLEIPGNSENNGIPNASRMLSDWIPPMSNIGMHVVGKGSWKNREVGIF